MKKESILVTGCAGFIGSNFCRQFGQMFPDIEIIGLDDLSSGRKGEIDQRVIFNEGSITDTKLVESIFEKHKPSYVFHFAAVPRVSFSVEHPGETTRVNIFGTVLLLEKAKNHGVKRFIISSSSSVYGGAINLPTNEADNIPSPKSPYAMQKYVDERFCQLFSSLYEMDTVCLRYFNVFGPGQYGDSPYSSVISGWLESLYFPSNNKAYLEGDGEQTRDFCYVDNVVSANILAMQSKNKFAGDYFNIAHGQRTSVNEVKKLIEEYSGKNIELEHRPTRIGDVRDSHADISKAFNILGYKPSINFEDGLKRTVEWFKTRNN
ncbi:MAG: NAD-dependent epimerase/dehydratase family protein [Minisyncoccia bacterium]